MNLSANLIMYIEINMMCIIILTILYIQIYRTSSEHIENLILRRLIFFIGFMCLSDMGWAVMAQSPLAYPRWSLHVVNISFFVSTGFIIYTWLCYIESSIHVDWIHKKWGRFLSRGPIILLFVLVLLSPAFKFIYYIDDAGIYHRGFLYAYQPIFMISYILAIMIQMGVLAHRRDNYIHRSQMFTLGSFGIFPLLMFIVQVGLPGVPSTSVGITVAAILLYTNHLNSLISLDTLTQINNRRTLMRYLDSRMRYYRSNETTSHLYLLMIDVDLFKHINDTYGHAEGDNALIRVAEALKKASYNLPCLIARYGGDEFSVIYEAENEDAIRELIEEIQKELEAAQKKAQSPYALTLSIGYSKFNVNMPAIPDFVSCADTELYKKKKARKREK